MAGDNMKCVYWGSSDPKTAYDALDGLLGNEDRAEAKGFVITRTRGLGDHFITVSRPDGYKEFRATKVWHPLSPNEYNFERWVGSASEEAGWVRAPLGSWLSTLNFIEPQLESFATLFGLKLMDCPQPNS